MIAKEKTGTRKKHDWAAARTDYITGDEGTRGIAKKHGIPYATLMTRANNEHWAEDRKAFRAETARRAQEEAAKRTADLAIENATKLEKARRLLIDRIVTAIEQMPKNGGTRVRQSQTDKNTGKQMSVDYDLTTLVSAFEKLSSGATADTERQKRFAAENNSVLMSYADLFSRPMPSRTIEEIEGDGDV